MRFRVGDIPPKPPSRTEPVAKPRTPPSPTESASPAVLDSFSENATRHSSSASHGQPVQAQLTQAPPTSDRSLGRLPPSLHDAGGGALPLANREGPSSAGEPDRESDSGSSQATEAYNSEDEHGARAADVAAAAAVAAAGDVGLGSLELTLEEREAAFRAELARVQWRIAVVRADGNCLFRALAYAIWGDEELHAQLRARVMDYIADERDYFSQFVAEDFRRYVRRKRRDGTHGNHVELQAAADMLNVRIEVYAYSLMPVAVIDGWNRRTESGAPPVRLSFHRGSHYNVVVGSLHPTPRICAKKLAALLTAGRPIPSAAPAAPAPVAVDEDARIAALADCLATEEELEQAALEQSIAELHRSSQRASASTGASSSHAHNTSNADTRADDDTLRRSIRDLSIQKDRTPSPAKAGPSSAGPSSSGWREGNGGNTEQR